LAAIGNFEKNYLQATYHLDSAFRMLKAQGLHNELKLLAETAEFSYQKANDIAGIIYITNLLKGKNEAYCLWEKIYPDYLKSIDIENAIVVYTKFISYGLYDFAILIRSNFYD
jgi:hypothetical protein